jgi:hypothetical protein
MSPKSVPDRVHTVDLPVTLASLLDVEIPEDVDGVNRMDLMPERVE